MWHSLLHNLLIGRDGKMNGRDEMDGWMDWSIQQSKDGGMAG